jgi:hypothetical protein
MDSIILLNQARAAGLTVTVEGDKLRILGPRRAEGIAKELLARKNEIMLALAGSTPLPPITPDDLPADWHFLWDERAAIMESDDGMTTEYAEAAALKDILRQMQAAGALK